MTPNSHHQGLKSIGYPPDEINEYKRMYLHYRVQQPFTLRNQAISISAHDILRTAMDPRYDGSDPDENFIVINDKPTASSIGTRRRVPVRSVVLNTLIRKYPKLDFASLGVTSSDARRITTKCGITTADGYGIKSRPTIGCTQSLNLLNHITSILAEWCGMVNDLLGYKEDEHSVLIVFWGTHETT
jgi:hypothetical protein